MSLEVLPVRLQKFGWHLRQEGRHGDLAIYRRWKLYDGKEGAVHYEVIRIVHQQARETATVSYQAKEVYPTSKSWGTRGWTFKTLPEAQAKMQSLIRLAQEEMHDA